MFYLVEFSKTIKENLFIGLIFSLSTLAILTTAHFGEELDRLIISKTTIEKKTPFFNALISGSVSVNSISRKMKQLPGVIAVKNLGTVDMAEKIKNLDKTFGTDVLDKFGKISYQKLKIEIMEGLETKNRSLIQEYLARLVGKESVTMGQIRKFKSQKQTLTFLNIVRDWGSEIIWLVLFLLWVSSLGLLMPRLKILSDTIESFQRREGVLFKVTGAGILSLTTIFIAGLMALKPQFVWEVFAIAMVLMITGYFVLMATNFKRA